MQQVSDAIAKVPGWASRDDVRFEPLPGGLTNANYVVTVGVERYVLRVSGPNAAALGIGRAHEARATSAAAAIGAAPQVIHVSADEGLLVTRFLNGRAPTREDMRAPAVMGRVVDALRRVHGIPLNGAARFCPFRKAEHWAREAVERGATFPADFASLAERMRGVERSRLSNPAPPRFCHNDPVRGNIIDAGQSIRFVDWEYAGAGDLMFDLAILSLNNGYDAADEHAMLSRYFGVADLTQDLLRDLHAMKRAFDYAMGAWYVLQTVTSTLDAPFAKGVRWHLDRLRRSFGEG